MLKSIKRIPAKVVIGIIVVFISFFVVSTKEFGQSGYLEITFFDVGQGDSILIKSPGNKYLLVDGGPDGSIIELLPQYLPLTQSSLDLVFLTHPHSDHLEGLTYLPDYYEIKKMIQMPVPQTTNLYMNWLEYLRESNIPVNDVYSGDRIDVEQDLYFDILWPVDDNWGSINNTSIVMRMVYKNFSVLLMGDAEALVEEYLVDEVGDRLESNILKVGHHGSLSSSTIEFLQNVLPQYSIISVGENSFGHPSPETTEKLEMVGSIVLRTDEDGDITFYSDGETFGIID